MFVGKAMILERTTWKGLHWGRLIGSDLTWKHFTPLETLGKDKHSSLLQTFAIYDFQKLIKLGPGMTGL